MLCPDPNAFLPESIDTATAQYNARLERMLAGLPQPCDVPVETTRRAREEGRGPFGPLKILGGTESRTIPGPAGDIALRVFLPSRIKGVYLHFHGGGWALGGVHHQDPLLWDLARQCELAVLSVDYRLAPENPYPAGPDDCESAALWLARNAKSEFGSDRVLVGGESAGAHLSAVTMLRMRDKHGFTGFAAANLTYGIFDVSMTPSASNWGSRYFILSTPILRWFGDRFVAPEHRRHPDVSPLYASLHGLAPAIFTAGTLDPLIDDTLFMHARWAAAGNRAELAVYPGGAHAFNVFPIALAEQANARIHRFLMSA
ncbi:MAG: alpha/beta hydrolase [Bryobacteraceae bacterium]